MKLRDPAVEVSRGRLVAADGEVHLAELGGRLGKQRSRQGEQGQREQQAAERVRRHWTLEPQFIHS
jgi:hypothetical protein